VFPHPCGDQFERAVAAGADPKAVIPDDYVVVRGGTKPIPPPGTEFSTSVGPTLEAAGSGVQHGQLRATTAGAIRAAGGVVEWVPQPSPRGTMNNQHAHVTEAGPTVFSELVPNPVPRKQRIDQGV
jgi:hypothetical protein